METNGTETNTILAGAQHFILLLHDSQQHVQLQSQLRRQLIRPTKQTILFHKLAKQLQQLQLKHQNPMTKLSMMNTTHGVQSLTKCSQMMKLTMMPPGPGKPEVKYWMRSVCLNWAG